MLVGNISLDNYKTKWRVESLRVFLYVICLLVLIVFYNMQNPFISWVILGPSFLALGIGFLVHLLLFLKLDVWKEDSLFLFISFVIDSLLLSYFIHKSGTYQSLFVIFHLLNIILASFLFKGAGALSIALVTSITFSLSQLMAPDYKSLSFLLVLAINNLSFFGVAGLAGYLSERLFNAEKEVVSKDEKLKSLEDLYELIIDKSPVGLVTFDSLSRVIQMNFKAISFFPLVKTEDKILDFFPAIKDLWQDIQKLEMADELVKEVGVAKEEDLQILKLRVTRISKSNNLFLLLIEDLTQYKKMEYSLKQNEKLAAVGGLAAGVAHEIRNPLAGISGSIELLSQTTQNEDDKKLMKIILREIDRLNNLITEFLDFSRPEKPPVDPCDLVFSLKEVIENVKANTKLNQNVVVDVNFPDKAVIKGYSDKLKQAFLNIIINAFQAMAQKDHGQLKVSIVRNQKRWKVLIKDNGDGMKEETLKRLFEPFYTTKSKGTGLGLAVTHKILEAHQALIFVRSELGQGTEFEFEFPCFDA